MNFGPREKYPSIRFTGISDKAGKELAETLSILKQADILIPDKKLETHLRKRLGITEISEEEQRKGEVSFTEDDFENLELSERLKLLKNSRG